MTVCKSTFLRKQEGGVPQLYSTKTVLWFWKLLQEVAPVKIEEAPPVKIEEEAGVEGELWVILCVMIWRSQSELTTICMRIELETTSNVIMLICMQYNVLYWLGSRFGDYDIARYHYDIAIS